MLGPEALAAPPVDGAEPDAPTAAAMAAPDWPAAPKFVAASLPKAHGRAHGEAKALWLGELPLLDGTVLTRLSPKLSAEGRVVRVPR